MLQRLSALRADRTAARLARVQSLINTLEDQAATLRKVPPIQPSSAQDAVIHDRWARKRAQSLAVLNTQIARLHGAAQPQREAFAREAARTAVLEKLRKK